MSTSAEIQELLHEHLTVIQLDITDDSHKHAGHQGAIESGGGHFHVRIVSDDFLDQNAVARHRMIYAALKTIKDKIHALGIKTYTQKELANYERNL